MASAVPHAWCVRVCVCVCLYFLVTWIHKENDDDDCKCPHTLTQLIARAITFLTGISRMHFCFVLLSQSVQVPGVASSCCHSAFILLWRFLVCAYVRGIHCQFNLKTINTIHGIAYISSTATTTVPQHWHLITYKIRLRTSIFHICPCNKAIIQHENEYNNNYKRSIRRAKESKRERGEKINK